MVTLLLEQPCISNFFTAILAPQVWVGLQIALILCCFIFDPLVHWYGTIFNCLHTSACNLESQKVLNWWTDFQLRLNNFHFWNYSEFCKHCEFQSHSKMWRNKTHKRNTKDTKYFRIPLSILQNTSECLHFRIPNTSHGT